MHGLDLGEPHDDAVLRDERPARLFDGDARERRGHDQQGALVEGRHELRPQSLEHGHRGDHEHDGRRHDEEPEAHDEHGDRPVHGAEEPADRIRRFGAEAAPQQQHHERRRQRDRQDRRGEHGEGLGVGERREQPPGLARQREDGQEADRDEQQREEDGPAHFLAGIDDDALAVALFRRRREPHMGVLDQHDDGIGEFADRDRDAAERHDVRGQAEVADADERHQDRQRQDDHHDQGRAGVEQEDEADDRDDHGLLHQRVRQRGDRAHDQLRSVVGRDESHAVRQPERRDLCLDGPDHLQGVRADAHHHDAAHRLARAVVVGGAAADVRPELHAGDVTQSDRDAARPHRDHALLEIGQVLHVAASAQHVLAAGQFEDAGADFGIGVSHGPGDVAEREAEADETVRVEDDLVLALEPTERGHLRDAGHGLQRRTHREVLEGAELGQVHPSGVVLQDVLIDPAHAAGVRPECRRHVWRQQLLHAPQLFEDPGTGPVDVSALVEQGVGEAHAEHRVAAHGHDAGRALQGANERVGDLVLHQIGAAPHPLGVDDDLRVGDVGQRIERRLSDGVRGPRGEQQHDAEHDPLVPGRQFDETFDHDGYSWCPACGPAGGVAGRASGGALAP